MSPADVLLAARDLIADPEHWCKVNVAERADGESTYADHSAHAFCAFGAVYTADPAGVLGRTWDFLYEAVGGPPIFFNDAPETTHADVLDAFDRAIRLAKDADQ